MTGYERREAVFGMVLAALPRALVDVGSLDDDSFEALAELVEEGRVEVWDFNGPNVILSSAEAESRGLTLHCPARGTNYQWKESDQPSAKRPRASQTLALTDARASGELFDFDELVAPSDGFLLRGEGVIWHGPAWQERMKTHQSFAGPDHPNTYCLVTDRVCMESGIFTVKG